MAPLFYNPNSAKIGTLCKMTGKPHKPIFIHNGTYQI